MRNVNLYIILSKHFRGNTFFIFFNSLLQPTEKNKEDALHNG